MFGASLKESTGRKVNIKWSEYGILTYLFTYLILYFLPSFLPSLYLPYVLTYILTCFATQRRPLSEGRRQCVSTSIRQTTLVSHGRVQDRVEFFFQ